MRMTRRGARVAMTGSTQAWRLANAQLESQRGGPFQATSESLAKYQCPEWFRDAKFGIWAHWGPQSVPMFGDWYARKMYEEGGKDGKYEHHLKTYGHPSKFGYKDIISLWKAEQFDPDRLMALYRAQGRATTRGHPNK